MRLLLRKMSLARGRALLLADAIGIPDKRPADKACFVPFDPGRLSGYVGIGRLRPWGRRLDASSHYQWSRPWLLKRLPGDRASPCRVRRIKPLCGLGRANWPLRVGSRGSEPRSLAGAGARIAPDGRTSQLSHAPRLSVRLTLGGFLWQKPHASKIPRRALCPRSK